MNLPLLLVPVLIGCISKTAACDQCQFVDSIDASNCKVYGTIDGMLVAWDRANQECLGAYNVKISSLDPLSAGCGEVANVNSFVNAIRFGTLENSVLGGLGDNFFVQGANGVYSLNDSIVVSGTTYDCEASASNCYNAMKDYFATTSGMQEMQDVCETLRAKVFVDKELEQSTLRIRLCEEIQSGVVVNAACTALGDQVDSQMEVYPEKECSGFAFGTGTKAIPGCATSPTGVTPVSAGTHHTKCMIVLGIGAALYWLL